MHILSHISVEISTEHPVIFALHDYSQETRGSRVKEIESEKSRVHFPVFFSRENNDLRKGGHRALKVSKEMGNTQVLQSVTNA